MSGGTGDRSGGSRERKRHEKTKKSIKSLRGTEKRAKGRGWLKKVNRLCIERKTAGGGFHVSCHWKEKEKSRLEEECRGSIKKGDLRKTLGSHDPRNLRNRTPKGSTVKGPSEDTTSPVNRKKPPHLDSETKFSDANLAANIVREPYLKILEEFQA